MLKKIVYSEPLLHTVSSTDGKETFTGYLIKEEKDGTTMYCLIEENGTKHYIDKPNDMTLVFDDSEAVEITQSFQRNKRPKKISKKDKTPKRDEDGNIIKGEYEEDDEFPPFPSRFPIEPKRLAKWGVFAMFWFIAGIVFTKKFTK